MTASHPRPRPAPNPLCDRGADGLRDRVLVRHAAGGDRPAMETLLRRHQGWIFNLALRMLWNREDAEDATQEILLRLAGRLSSFRGDSAFGTWAWRIAVNHLLDCRRSRAERAVSGFACYGQVLESIPDEPWGAGAQPGPEADLLAEEVKIGCVTGMLLCLDREQRLAFLLGAVFEATDQVAAAVLSLRPEAFRQRLARARRQLGQFMADRCGLVDPANPCRCARKTAGFIRAGIVDPDRLQFVAAHRRRIREVAPERARRLDHMIDELCSGQVRDQPFFEFDADVLTARLRLLLRGRRLRTLLDPSRGNPEAVDRPPSCR